jgi:hypothetical protein
MNKEIIQKQLKLLSLFFGMWALLLLNGFLMDILNKFSLTSYDLKGAEDGFIAIGLFTFTIFQMWAIFKYILKK